MSIPKKKVKKEWKKKTSEVTRSEVGVQDAGSAASVQSVSSSSASVTQSTSAACAQSASCLSESKCDVLIPIAEEQLPGYCDCQEIKHHCEFPSKHLDCHGRNKKYTPECLEKFRRLRGYVILEGRGPKVPNPSRTTLRDILFPENGPHCSEVNVTPPPPPNTPELKEDKEPINVHAYNGDEVEPTPEASHDSIVSASDFSYHGEWFVRWEMIDWFLCVLIVLASWPGFLAALVVRISIALLVHRFIRVYRQERNGTYVLNPDTLWLDFLVPLFHEQIRFVRRVSRNTPLDGLGQPYVGELGPRTSVEGKDMRKVVQFGMDLCRQEPCLTSVVVQRRSFEPVAVGKIAVFAYIAYVAWRLIILIPPFALGTWTVRFESLNSHWVYLSPLAYGAVCVYFWFFPVLAYCKTEHMLVSLTMFKNLLATYGDGTYDEQELELIWNLCQRTGGIMMPYDLEWMPINTCRLVMAAKYMFRQKYTIPGSVVFQPGPDRKLVESVQSILKGTIVDSVAASARVN